jgi:hypothetical protein
MTLPAYPFEPRSNRYLRAGQFWAVPLDDGRFACGRVMAVPAFGAGDRVGMVVGLMDWVGDQPPSGADLAGRTVFDQAKTRFDAIRNTGGVVLGHRPLEADGLTSVDPDDVRVGATHRVWGAHTIKNRAEARFSSR